MLVMRLLGSVVNEMWLAVLLSEELFASFALVVLADEKNSCENGVLSREGVVLLFVSAWSGAGAIGSGSVL